MTDQHLSHAPLNTLTSAASDHPATFARAFNTGDPRAVEQLYESDALFIPQPGRAVSGTARMAANTSFQSLGLPLAVHPRQVYVADDIALLIVDWSISGTTADGDRTDIRGTATDVARRGSDGTWRYVIDNPWGTARCSTT